MVRWASTDKAGYFRRLSNFNGSGGQLHRRKGCFVPSADGAFVRISNYFLRFSNEYKRVHGEKSLNRNNWYEYVEYGTTNEVTIQLQRYGFSRESATYIKAHPQYFTVDGEGNVHVKNDLENCGDNEVVQQIPDIRFNTPELFVE